MKEHNYYGAELLPRKKLIMALMEWNDQFKTGILQIDSQHRKLVEIINSLHDAMREGKGKEVLAPVLGSLVNYTRTHFKDEERLMAQYGYPKLETHKVIHQKLVDKVMDLQEKFNSGNVFITVEVMIFLKDWLSGHILGDDMKYVPYINK